MRRRRLRVFSDTLQAQDNAQVIRFSRDVKTLYPMGGDRAATRAAIETTAARGDTALWDALYASVESLRDVSGRKAIVLLSDGVDDDGSGKPLSKHTVTEAKLIFRVRADYAKETAVFSVENWTE
jgi:Mg-chelatase subunit ChlD